MNRRSICIVDSKLGVGEMTFQVLSLFRVEIDLSVNCARLQRCERQLELWLRALCVPHRATHCQCKRSTNQRDKTVYWSTTTTKNYSKRHHHCHKKRIQMNKDHTHTHSTHMQRSKQNNIKRRKNKIDENVARLVVNFWATKKKSREMRKKHALTTTIKRNSSSRLKAIYFFCYSRQVLSFQPNTSSHSFVQRALPLSLSAPVCPFL